MMSLVTVEKPDHSTASTDDINAIRLRRSVALLYLGKPFFNELATGSYVRVQKMLGKGERLAPGVSAYRVARVVGIAISSKTYDPWRSEGGYAAALSSRGVLDAAAPRTTNIYIHLGIGSLTQVPTKVRDRITNEVTEQNLPRLTEIFRLSDQRITDSEWAEYLSRLAENRRKTEKSGGTPLLEDAMPTRGITRAKVASAADLVLGGTAFREDDVEKSLARAEQDFYAKLPRMPNITYWKNKYVDELAAVEAEKARLPESSSAETRKKIDSSITRARDHLAAIAVEESRRQKVITDVARAKLAAHISTIAPSITAGGVVSSTKNITSMSAQVNAVFTAANLARMALAAEDERMEVAIAPGDPNSNPYERQRTNPINLFRVQGITTSTSTATPVIIAAATATATAVPPTVPANVLPSSTTQKEDAGFLFEEEDDEGGGAASASVVEVVPQPTAIVAAPVTAPVVVAAGGFSLAAFRARLKATV